VTLRGRNYTSGNPLTPEDDQALTGAFVPFGQQTREGEVVAGQVPCTGAVMRVGPLGGAPELVAWGFRNPFGLAFAPDGRLFLTENGFDERGSRPVFGGADYLWEVEQGRWYGWPDYEGGRPLNENWHKPAGGKVPDKLLAADPETPPEPAATFGVHSSSNRFDFSRSERFGHVGQAFVAQVGDLAPKVGEVFSPVGFQVVRADPATGLVESFAANRGKQNAPASLLGTGGLERPVDAHFDPSGEALYVVDFGVLSATGKGTRSWKQTGVLWRITRAPGGAP
jgi:glucose/arabinose dehydrogenase